MESRQQDHWWYRIADHPYFWFFAPIAVVLGVPGALSATTEGSLELAFSVGVLAPLAIILSILLVRNLSEVRLLSFSQTRFYFPYLRDVDEEKKTERLVDHNNRTEALISSIKGKYGAILMVGESGAGKSTLAYTLRARNKASIITAENSFSYILNEMENHIAHGDDCIPPVLILDQFERIQSSLSKATGKEIRRFHRIINDAKKRQRAFVFVTRSDLLGPILELMSVLEPYIYVVGGLPFPPKSTQVDGVINRLELLGLTEKERADAKNSLLHTKIINSFAFQIGGYLAEALTAKQRKKLFCPIVFNEKAVSLYIDLIFLEYMSKQVHPDLLIHIETILFTISQYNRRHSLPISQERITHLTNMPIHYVERGASFLIEKGVVESTNTGRQSYFVSHDLIASEVLDAPPRHMQPDYRVAIRETCNNQVDFTSEETIHIEMNPFRRIVSGRAGGPFVFSFSMLAIWMAAILYSFRLKSTEFGIWLQNNIPSNLIYIGGDVDIENATYMFFPITFTLYMWVLFIYGLDRGYFYYLLKRNAIAPWVYFFVHIAGSIGIAIGLIASVAPALFPLGVIIPGLIIALAFGNVAYKSSCNKCLHYKYTLQLFWEIILNMIISVSVVYLISRVLVENSSKNIDVQSIFIISSVSILYCAFAYAMRERLGSETGHWTLLAIHSASKERGQ